jgi:hypothetical protein
MNDKGLFSSEIVRKEIEQMHQLYKEIYMAAPIIDMQSREDKEKLLDKMERLIEMQEILYTRVNLSDDEDSEGIKENFRIAAKQMGLPATQIGPEVFKIARTSINALRQHVLDNEQ